MFRAMAAAGLVLLVSAAAPAAASTVTGSYTGRITSLNFGDAVPGAPDIHLNDTYQINYSYDTAAPAVSTGHGTTGDGVDFDDKGYTGLSFSITVGAFHFDFANPRVDLSDFADTTDYADDLSVWGTPSIGAVVSDVPGWTTELGFFGAYFPNTVLNGTDLPLSSLDPATYYAAYLQITLKQVGTDVEYFIVGDTDAIATTPIPASGVLFLTALGGLGLGAWRRQRA